MSNANERMLPDAYAKGAESNNYKLLRLLALLYEGLQADLKSINRARDINFAAGKTLDNIGAMTGVSRNGNTDAQYRLAILARVAALSTTSDCNTTIQRIESILGLPSGTISLEEINRASPPNTAVVFTSCVMVIGLTLEMLGYRFTAAEIDALVRSVIPAGVGLVPLQFAGTLVLYTSWYTPSEDYPTLYGAWLEGQKKLASGTEIGLAGSMNVPDEFAELAYETYGIEYPTTGTYTGGTLGVNSGDIIAEVE